MVRSYPVRTSLGGALLVALLATGCGAGDDDAAASPSSAVSSEASGSQLEGASASPEPTSESTPGAGSGATSDAYVPASLSGPARNVPKPVMPDLAKEESREGAQAFLDYWSDAMWYAYQTGDTSYAREIISPHCQVCIDELKEVEQVYEGGQWLTGGRQSFQIQSSDIREATDGVYKPVVKYQNDEVQLVDFRGVVDTVPSDPASGEPLLVYVDYLDGSWVYITMAPMPGS